MRSFVSIELPDEIKKNIENLIKEFRVNLTPIKWVEVKNLHITLKFLGWIEDNKIDSLCDTVKAILKGNNKFEICMGGFGAFPTTKHPRVVWIGISDGADKLINIATDLEEKLAKAGFREEEREFSPHITIGRIKEKIDIETLEKHIKEKEFVELGSFEVKYLSFMKSTLKKNGPIYEEIEKFYFGK